MKNERKINQMNAKYCKLLLNYCIHANQYKMNTINANECNLLQISPN